MNPPDLDAADVVESHRFSDYRKASLVVEDLVGLSRTERTGEVVLNILPKPFGRIGCAQDKVGDLAGFAGGAVPRLTWLRVVLEVDLQYLQSLPCSGGGKLPQKNRGNHVLVVDERLLGTDELLRSIDA